MGAKNGKLMMDSMNAYQKLAKGKMSSHMAGNSRPDKPMQGAPKSSYGKAKMGSPMISDMKK